MMESQSKQLFKTKQDIFIFTAMMLVNAISFGSLNLFMPFLPIEVGDIFKIGADTVQTI